VLRQRRFDEESSRFIQIMEHQRACLGTEHTCLIGSESFK
jgi:hypothetical protein